jgi:two-component system, NtrC family, sensor kinase
MNEQVIEAGKLASLGELAAGIAHEINNPVAVMVEEAGWMQDLLDEEEGDCSPNSEEFRRSLNQIKTQGTRCKQITHKLLSFARKTDPTPKKVHLNEVVRDAIGLCQQRVRSGRVKLFASLAENLPTIRVSPSEAQQVFVNLINNALDVLEGTGGTVKITTRTEGDFVVCDVADDGPGIPSYVLPRIFDPFFTTKPVGKGTGLGLSICYGIVRKLDGDITVNTAEGVGTTFHIKFPAPKPKKRETEAAS